MTGAFSSDGSELLKQRGRHAVADERVDLVLHQRDQRRDDHRQARAHERRRLEAQRLAAAGRQHDQRIAAGQDRVHRLALERTERGVAPVFFEDAVQQLMVPIREFIAGSWTRLSRSSIVAWLSPI